MKAPMTPAQLLQLEVETFHKIAGLSAGIATRESEAVDRLAEGKDLELCGDEQQIEQLRRSIKSMRDRRVKAIVETQRRRATEMRDQSIAKRDEYKKLIAATEKHLRSLSELLEVPYTRAVLNMQVGSGWGPWAGMPTALVPLDDRNLDEIVREYGGQFHKSKIRRLLDESNLLNSEADQLDRAEIPMHGEAEGGDLTALLQDATNNPLRIQPPLSEIAELVAALDVRLNVDAPSSVESPRRYRIFWRDGHLLEDNCHLEVGNTIFRLSAVAKGGWA